MICSFSKISAQHLTALIWPGTCRTASTSMNFTSQNFHYQSMTPPDQKHRSDWESVQSVKSVPHGIFHWFYFIICVWLVHHTSLCKHTREMIWDTALVWNVNEIIVVYIGKYFLRSTFSMVSILKTDWWRECERNSSIMRLILHLLIINSNNFSYA